MSLSSVGPWARHKLSHLKKYLTPYAEILAPRVESGRFEGFHYIDAFAGPGVHSLRSTRKTDPLQQVFRDAAEHIQSDEGQRQFLAGSPRVALETVPAFTTYVFVEKSDDR